MQILCHHHPIKGIEHIHFIHRNNNEIGYENFKENSVHVEETDKNGHVGTPLGNSLSFSASQLTFNLLRLPFIRTVTAWQGKQETAHTRGIY